MNQESHLNSKDFYLWGHTVSTVDPPPTVDFVDPKKTSLCRSDRLQVPEKKKSPGKPTVRLQPHYSFTPNLKFGDRKCLFYWGRYLLLCFKRQTDLQKERVENSKQHAILQEELQIGLQSNLHPSLAIPKKEWTTTSKDEQQENLKPFH